MSGMCLGVTKSLLASVARLTQHRAHYLGYSSDICRSFFIDPPKVCPFKPWAKLLATFGIMPQYQSPRSPPTSTNPDLHSEKLRIWDLVFEAQTESAKMFQPNNTAASVDVAARTVVAAAGFEKQFTHRVGHGIGIKGNTWQKMWWNLLRPVSTRVAISQ